jgi:hypothetical protein
MRNTDKLTPVKPIQIPDRIRKDGWWLVDDLPIPRTGPRRRNAGCALTIIEGDRKEGSNGRDD